MNLGSPLSMLALALLPVLWGVHVRSRRQSIAERRALFDAEIESRLLKPIQRSQTPLVLFLLAVFFLCVALVRPQFGYEEVVQRREGVDIAFLVDVSKSMLAADVSPSRLERTRFLILDLLSELKGDRVSLITFAGVSFLESPLTYDYGTFRLFLDELSPDLIPVPGTNLESALDKAVDSFKGPDGELRKGRDRIVMLFSDGEELTGAHSQTLSKLTSAGVRVFTVGVGSPVGAPILERGSYKRDRTGNVVVTKLNEEVLQDIAKSSGGGYLGGSLTGEAFKRFFHESVSRGIKRSEIEGGVARIWKEYFQIPLSLALLLLILSEFHRGVLGRRA
jgi:Ca-activated chloride channel homolog